MIQRNYIFACPNLIEKLIHNFNRFIPDQLIIALTKNEITNQTSRTTIRTSEKAGAQIFLYIFHSSPSVVTILGPKTEMISYSRAGLGNRVLDDVTS